MTINILIGWNVILTILLVFIVAFNSERQARINKIELDIKKNEIYDTIIEEHATHYHPSYYDDYQQRMVTVKEAIACLYRKLDLHLNYVAEKTETKCEDVSAK